MSVFDLFPPDEFWMEFVPATDGEGYEIAYEITGRTRVLLERRADAAGMTFEEYLADLIEREVLKRP
ncbi:MAG TPA: hypothetical protein PLO23_06830 [Alphaproteobacteria bacterium]|mgnify:CR=1 FL=1|nr:hypothetical protein [Alphaproteobacteria bacterium]